MPIPGGVASSYNRSFGDEADAIGMELCRAMFVRIDEAERKINGVYMNVVEERSSLRLDDKYLGAWRGGSLHRGALGSAVDALMTIKVVLDQNVIPMIGLYPLLRAVVENACLSIYLTSPPSRDVRLGRAYQVAFDDARLRRASEVERGLSGAADKLSMIDRELRSLIESRGSLGPGRSFRFARVEYSNLVKKAAEVMRADPAIRYSPQMSLLSWWQALSGLAHGKQWASMQVLERSGAIENAAEQSAHVRTTSSPVVIAVALEASMQTVEAAFRLFGQRSRAAWNQPEDATEPPTVPFTELAPGP